MREVACAFANSVRVPSTGVVFFGVDRKGTPTGRITAPDETQRKITVWLQKCYNPPIAGVQQFAIDVGGQQVLALVVPESRNRPHFTGPAFIRVGSETRQASECEFQKLIEDRTDLVWALRPWVGKKVSVEEEHYRARGADAWAHSVEWTLEDVNPFFVKLEGRGTTGRSFSLSRIYLEHDVGKDRPLLRVALK